MNLKMRKQVAEKLVGPITWESEVMGKCTCPGADAHGTPGDTATIYLDRIPTINCFHQSCIDEVKTANAQLRSAIGTAENPTSLPNQQAPSEESTDQVNAAENVASPSEPQRGKNPEQKGEIRRLKMLASANLPEIFALHPISYLDWSDISPTKLSEDKTHREWRYLLQNFDQKDFIWIGDFWESGRLENSCNFREVGEWLKESVCPGPYICPAIFKRDSFQRSAANVISSPFIIVESDTLTKDEMSSVFLWLAESWHLVAVVDTGNKSLHGWFKRPTDLNSDSWERIKNVLDGLGCDLAMLRDSQPCRLPGWFRVEKGRWQHLLYLDKAKDTSSGSSHLADKATSPDLSKRLKHPPIYYDKKSRGYWGYEKDGGWTTLTERAAIDRLRGAGLSDKRNGIGLSEVEATMDQIRYENGVDAAAPLSGYKKGFYRLSGRKVLVTRSYELIKPSPGEWRTLAAFLLGLLGHEQTLVFLYWLKLAYEALRDGTRRPGQALVLAGPRDGGKSFLQNHVITPVLGGRGCRCYLNLSGKTNFNGDLFEAEHLIVDDDVPFATYPERMALASRIKSIVASELQSAHYKYCEAFSVVPSWRLTMSVNDSPESLLVLPPMGDSLDDKIIIFQTQNTPLPMSTETQDERDAFRNTIFSELPAMLYRLTHTWIPEKYAGRRFGLKHFHHPKIIQALQELTPAEKLLSIIDSALFLNGMPCELGDEGDSKVWRGTASQLEAILVGQQSPFRREAEKLLTWGSACARHLGDLAKHHPKRVANRRTNSSRYWVIWPPEAGSYPSINEPLPTKGPVTPFLNFIDNYGEVAQPRD